MKYTIKYPKVTRDEVIETGFDAYDILREKYGEKYTSMHKAKRKFDNIMTALIWIFILSFVTSACLGIAWSSNAKYMIPAIVAISIFGLSIIAIIVATTMYNHKSDCDDFAIGILRELESKTGIRGLNYCDMSNILNLDFQYYHVRYWHDIKDLMDELERFPYDEYDDFEIEQSDKRNDKFLIYGCIKNVRCGYPMEITLTPTQFRKLVAVDDVLDFSFVDDLYKEFVQQVESLRKD